MTKQLVRRGIRVVEEGPTYLTESDDDSDDAKPGFNKIAPLRQDHRRLYGKSKAAIQIFLAVLK